MATIQAGLAAGMKKAGLLKEIPAGPHPANDTFMIEHEADFEKTQQRGPISGNSYAIEAVNSS